MTSPTPSPPSPHTAAVPRITAPEITAPWGSAPTPLLPAWHLQACAALPAAKEITTHNPSVTTIADMSRFWDGSDCSQLSGPELRSVAASVAPYLPPPTLIVIPAGVRRAQLMRLPLRPRTMRRTAMLPQIIRKPVTVADLLGPPGFAAGTLIDAMCVIEAALATTEAGTRSEAVATFYTPEAIASPHTAAAARAAVRIAEWINTLPQDRLDTLRTQILPERPPRHRRKPRRYTPTDTTIADTAHLRTQLHNVAAHDIAAAAAELATRLGAICTTTELATATDTVLPAPAPTASEPITAAATLTRRMITARTGYTIENNLALDPEATQTAKTIATRSTEIADDVGLINETNLKTNIHIPPNLTANFEQLATAAKLVRLSGHLSRRDTDTAAVKAALIAAGQPQTRNQLANTLNMNPKLVGNRLSRIRTITRADKHHWGLTEWIDRPYDSLATQMRKTIKAAGGTIELEKLANEMNQQWGVSPISVYSLASTPAFQRTQNHISIAKIPAPPKPTQTPTQATHTFKVAQRHLDGYSLASIPRPLAALLGCGPGVSTTAQVTHPPNTRDLSVIWRPTSVSGPEIGRASDALDAIGAQPGDTIKLTAHHNGTITLELHQTTQQPVI